MADKVWIIPALPALSFLLTLAFGKRTPGKGHFFGLAAVGIAFVLFRRHVLRTTLNRISAVGLATIVVLVFVGRVLAAHAGIAPAHIVFGNALVMATSIFVTASATFRTC